LWQLGTVCHPNVILLTYRYDICKLIHIYSSPFYANYVTDCWKNLWCLHSFRCFILCSKAGKTQGVTIIQFST
jgi:hypothetical protein